MPQAQTHIKRQVRLACAIGFQRLHLLRWRVHQRFELDKVVHGPSLAPQCTQSVRARFSLSSGLCAWGSRLGGVMTDGFRSWMDRQASTIVFALEAFRVLDSVEWFVRSRWSRSTAWLGKKGRSSFGQYPRVKARLVLLYWIAFRSAPTAQQPALEIQPREDIRRCRGDE
ncbi:BQ5605_C006g03903 [Microbotryum silenes-dioicae]|uniref:BQ5605_C006g03903 protein n=1 Tax=Microbotryum silenes-dioicae TaxID=796604 RepID=A0A2X0M9I8_9BASI|nr:BQ5605_C006g03903 [Microbotryum silenes-dioicae]